MRIALFGGRFDPPHNGHLKIAEYILQTEQHIDEVWLIPANTHPWRPIIASGEDRVYMTKLLVQGGDTRITVSDIDIKRGGETYTIDTIRLLQQQTNNTYYWVCGSDQIENFHKWKEYAPLQKMISFLIIPRKGFSSSQRPENCIVPSLEYTPSGLSSSWIRDKIQKGLSITDVVPKKEEEYIKKYKLYT